MWRKPIAYFAYTNRVGVVVVNFSGQLYNQRVYNELHFKDYEKKNWSKYTAETEKNVLNLKPDKYTNI